MSSAQQFVSSQRHPWVLITVQGNGQPGRRPPTSVAWLEHDCGDYFDGGPVFMGRDGRWHFQYKHQQKIAKVRVLHTFGCARGRLYGPSTKMIIAAKAALPLIPEIA